jgi:hypothetical protein
LLSRSLLERRIANRSQVTDSLSGDGQGWGGRLGTDCASLASRDGSLERRTDASRVFATVFGVGE